MKFGRFLLLGLLVVPAFGQAQLIWQKDASFVDPNGLYLYSGRVEFSQTGTTLRIDFSNTAVDPADFNRRVLNALFWDMAGNPTLSGGDAFIPAGSSQINGGDPPAQIDDHWAFKQALAANQYGNAKYGISSVGLGIFGPPNTFSGVGGSPNGVDYGLVPTAGTALGTPLVKNAMAFTFNLPVGYTLDPEDISNVWFQYGSAQNEFFFNVPEPGSMIALGLGAIALISRKKRKKSA
jgi:hypothetical protein